ncbi:MAG: RING finger protein [Planctomycetota bacterium]
MECLLIFFAILVFATFAIRAAAGGESGSSRRRSYQQVARQFSGRFVPGGFFGQPTVRFRYGDTFAVLTEATSRGPHPGRCTQLQVNWSDARFRAEIACHLNAAHLTPFSTMQVIKAGDPEFDRRVVIHGTDEEQVVRFLSDGVRWQIIRLLELLGDEHVYILIGRGHICIQKLRPIRSFVALKLFVEICLELYDQAMITQAVGIHFIESGEAVALEHVICKVCGDEIAGHEMVYCQRCKTPHHGDCWQYTGSCSVYGCLEKNFRRPQAATATNPPPKGSNTSQQGQ